MSSKSFVLNVNVWITIFYNEQEYYFCNFIKKHGLTIYCSPDLTKELEKVLQYKKFTKKFVKSIKYYIDLYFDVT